MQWYTLILFSRRGRSLFPLKSFLLIIQVNHLPACIQRCSQGDSVVGTQAACSVGAERPLSREDE